VGVVAVQDSHAFPRQGFDQFPFSAQHVLETAKEFKVSGPDAGDDADAQTALSVPMHPDRVGRG
jgi:hypothetical protein